MLLGKNKMRILKCIIVGTIFVFSGFVSAININYDILTANLDEYGVDLLLLGENNKDVKPGDSVIFTIEITNTGSLKDTYEIRTDVFEFITTEFNGETIDWYTPHFITLCSGESKTFEITVNVYYYKSGPARIWLAAYSQNDTTMWDGFYLIVNIISDNEPPETPRGEYQGFPDNYFLVWSTDPEGDRIRYGINWSDCYRIDKCTVDYWSDYYESGEKVILPYEGNSPYIRIIAEDEYGASSLWSPSIKNRNSKVRLGDYQTYFIQKILRGIIKNLLI